MNIIRIVKHISFGVIFILINLHPVIAQIPEIPEDISPLLIGEIIPECSLINKEGESINLNDMTKAKKTVLVFYRGGWCPYCNMQLAGLAASEKDIIKLGYQIIAVSPDDYRNLKPTIDKDEINYEVYSDPNGKFIQQMGIAFTTAPKTKEYIEEKTVGKTTKILPVPTVMVLNTQGEILFEYISPNYSKRISPELLLAVLKNLN